MRAAEPLRPPRSLGAFEQSNARTLSDADLEALAVVLAEREGTPAATRQSGGALVDAAQVAAMLGVSRWWVYDHADELGAVRLGHGLRPRLRFDLERVAEAVTSRSGSARSDTPANPGQERKPARRRRPRSGTGPALLPIRGDEPPCP